MRSFLPCVAPGQRGGLPAFIPRNQQRIVPTGAFADDGRGAGSHRRQILEVIEQAGEILAPVALLDGGTARTGQRMSTWCIMASSMADVLPGAFSLIAKAPRPAREVSGTMCASSPFLWQALGPMSTSLTLAVISIACSEPDFT
jgi:hypothetical protein